jgi:nucleoside-diphosphate-sugar epimerase
MKYLVLGSEGLIGKNFCNFLESIKETVVRWDIKMGLNYDLRNFSYELKNKIENCDYILFAAFDIGGFKFLSNVNENFIENNMRIMSNTFPLLKNKKFIFLSTTMVNIPDNEYGALKKVGEHYTNKLNGINTRLWNVYDYETSNERSHVMADFIDSALKNKKINILSNGEEERQFLHANDCSKALHYIFNNYNTFMNNKFIDLSSFEWISIKEIANIINEFIPCDSINLGTQKDYYVKNNPNDLILKYIKPQINIRDGIKNIIEKTINEKNIVFNNQNYLNQIINTTLNGKGDSDKHLATLFSFILQLGSKNILELGVRKGVTTLPLLCGAKLVNGTVTSVDINDTEFICPEDLSSIWSFHKSDAIEFLKNNNTVWDLIFLDDWHSYDHVKKELELLDSKVTPSSIIILHDLMYANYEPHYHSDMAVKDGQWANGGPYRAVCELNTNFWEFSTIPSCNGLTLLRKKYSSLYNKK